MQPTPLTAARKLRLGLAGVLAWAGVSGGLAAQEFRKDVQPFLEKYCYDCHGHDKTKGDLDLELFKDASGFYRDQRVWRQLVTQVVAGEMPPPERKTRPSHAEIEALQAGVRGLLNQAVAQAKVDPGKVTVRRLNRTEYNNTIRDLCYVDGNFSVDFPADDTGYGFDNIGDVLTFSPVHLERFIAAAKVVAERAMPTAEQKLDVLNVDGYNMLPRGRSEDQMRVFNAATLTASFEAPREGEYIFRAHLVGMGNAGDPAAVVNLVVDGKTIGTQTLKLKTNSRGAEKVDAKVRLAPGKHALAVTWTNPPGDLTSGSRRLGTYRYQLLGPTDTRTDLQRKLADFAQGRKGDDRARFMANWFVSRAFRRPATPVEIQRYAKVFTTAETAGGAWEAGAQAMISAVLASPKFIFRIEQDDQPLAKDAHPVSEFALASRLSYFLWGSMPDEELFGLANQGKLAANLPAQTTRLLKDPRAQYLVTGFALQWLQTRRLALVTPDAKLFPEFDDALRASMVKETELFLSEIVREDRSVFDIIDADFTYLDRPLAELYRVADVPSRRSGDFVRVTLPKGERGGVLTQASILTATSNPDRTSPVKRGKWILEQILGTPPPPAPADVPSLEGQKQLTGNLRQRLEQHRANPACASCHNRMDALGFAFEKFDAIGRGRTQDEGVAIDTAGKLPDGRTFAGATQLKAVLKADRAKYVRNLSAKLLTYGLGRGLEFYDEPALDNMVVAVEKGQLRFSALVMAVVQSEPFRLRRGASQVETVQPSPKKK
jgi:mono/diheme cytochrome c family protein